MKRLYNEYSACPHEGTAQSIDLIMADAVNQVWEEIEKDDVCPRDAESLCHRTISGIFAEKILRRAFEKRRGERLQKDKQ